MMTTDVWRWIAMSAVGFALGGGTATIVGADKTTKEEVNTQIELKLAPIVTEQKLIRQELEQLNSSIDKSSEDLGKKLDRLIEKSE